MSTATDDRTTLVAEVEALRRRVAELERERRAAEATAVTDAEINGILSALPDLIFLSDARASYRKIFTAEPELLAAPADELVGKTAHEVLPPEVAQGIQAIIDLTLATGERQRVEYPVTVSTGVRWFEATVVPVTLPASASAEAPEPCVLWVARDITERRAVEASERAAREAIERDRLKSEFLARMSHELRTPLNGILGFLQVLSRSPLDERQEECAAYIGQCARSLLSIISDLLDFSRHDAARMALRAEPFELASTVNAVVEIFREQHRRAPVQYSVSVEEEVPSQVRGDPDRIRQIVTNLVSNASKYTVEGHIRVSLSAGEALADGRRLIRIEVADTGVGIPESALGSVFDPFVRADQSLTRSRDGTGLGLAIVKQLVDLMDGDIHVHSTLGRGSVFSVVVPLAPVTESTPRAPAAAPKPPPRARSLRVLVAEDNEVGQLVARRFLEDYDCEVMIASDGAEAVAAVGEGEFDLVFMDCQMPVLDGYEATRQIRAGEPEGAHVPIIALTAHALEQDRKACFAAGMDDYLSKPLLQEPLEQVLAKWARTTEDTGPPRRPPSEGAPATDA
ncbi:ATP-binding protein [Haliangium sp.]|uniref:PAS domain-containing sensor histidine kinase n=1 Tax=Haliangium sp. TaxID=2663208 RepID=UPI003D10B34C